VTGSRRFVQTCASGLDEGFTVPAGRGDEARRSGCTDTRDSDQLHKLREIYVPDLHIDNR
jgi:hypothetical protein